MDLLWLTWVGSFLAIGFAAYLFASVLRKDSGTEKMREIARFVSEGAFAYLKRQYSIVSLFFIVVFCVLLWMAFKGYLVIFVPFAFLSGGFFSGLSGFIGMAMATKASSRTTSAARVSLNSALRVAFSAGGVMGFTVVGLGLLDLAIWYRILDWYYIAHPLPLGSDKISAITSTMLCFGDRKS
ncbi:sodium-translocating pyrophosphatase, partial [bacterium]